MATAHPSYPGGPPDEGRHLDDEWECPVPSCDRDPETYWPGINRHLVQAHGIRYDDEGRLVDADTGEPVDLDALDGSTPAPAMPNGAGDVEEIVREVAQAIIEEELPGPDALAKEVMSRVNIDATGGGSSFEDGLKGMPSILRDVREISRNTAEEVVTHKRREVLADFNMVLLEGPVQFRDDGQGGVHVRVDRTQLSDLFHQYLDQGDEVRVLVDMVTGDDYEEVEDAPKECVRCNSKKAKNNRRSPYCEDCWQGPEGGDDEDGS